MNNHQRSSPHLSHMSAGGDSWPPVTTTSTPSSGGRGDTAGSDTSSLQESRTSVSITESDIPGYFSVVLDSSGDRVTADSRLV